MKLKSILVAIAITLIGGDIVVAQNAIDIFRMSETSFSFSTARSSAMGGAFTSLGADGASTSINPAGIGMYRTIDIGITGSVLKTDISSLSSGPNGPFASDAQTNSNTLNNVTTMFNVYKDRTDVLRGVSIGFAYNTLNNFSSNQYTSSNFQTTSLIDVFSRNLIGVDPGGISSVSGDPMGVYRRNPTSIWGAMEAYNTGILFYDKVGKYYTPGRTLYVGDEVYSDLNINTRGGKSDSNFAVGFNLLDKIYIGATLGYQSYNYGSTRSYSEWANLEHNSGDLDNFEYIERLNIKGEGFSFKLGATVELFDGFNVAVAYHAPTLYNIEEEYSSDMYTMYNVADNNYFEAFSPYNVGYYKVSTAPMVLLGASYVIGKRAIISVDYDRVFYRSMKVRSGDFGNEVTSEINKEISNSYKNSNNVRVGAELRVGRSGYLRAGYAYYGNAEKGVADSYNSTTNISGGAGIKFSRFYVDFTYINMRSKTPSTYFYSDGSYKSDDTFTTNTIRNNFIYTVGLKF